MFSRGRNGSSDLPRVPRLKHQLKAEQCSIFNFNPMDESNSSPVDNPASLTDVEMLSNVS
jgi:hypothetical protein